ncbi:iron siderophore-binding protein [filamentous cyanobacterium CCT1]|nr:iron siderophore-binding protein [filamentous cyanobacterium CCT1]PSN78921.1 iron siderophore-binding protein [filamentous cyanobacterium CCP4]
MVCGLGLSLGLMLASCAGVPPGSSEDATQPAVPAATQRTVAHAMGNTAVPTHPQRVVVLTNEATDMVLALGLTPIGAVKSWSGEPYYDYIAEDMASVPVVGDEMQPSLEQIAALQPDLIIGSQVRQGQIYGQLSAIAPTVFSETIGEPWQDNLRLYGKALNREAEAEKLLADWDARVANLRQQFADRDLQVSLVRFLPGNARLYLKDSFPGQIIQDVGLQRPPPQAEAGFAQEVSLEQIPQMNGDVLFYFTDVSYDGGQSASDIARAWLDHPLWQQLDVVQQGKAYPVSDVVWTTAGGIQAAHLLLDDLEKHLAE